MLVQATIPIQKKPYKSTRILVQATSQFRKNLQKQKNWAPKLVTEWEIFFNSTEFQNSCVGQFLGWPVTIGFGYTWSYVLGED